MNPRERFQKIEELFQSALQLPPADRSAHLRAICPDPDLRREVEELLAAASQDDLSGIVREAAVGLERHRAESGIGGHPGMRLEPWELVSKLGEGGMGSVWLARRSDGLFEQDAAVKFILPEHFNSPQQRERFIRERRILARLSHPHIARILDGGATPAGEPYFIMEYVEGAPITVHANQHTLDLAARLRLWLDACDATAYANSKGVAHRDLKPANIMVTSEGIVKVLDFGIAKTKTDATLTVAGAVWASPLYSSPEQLAGTDPGERGDVYSLGVVLLELLTGKLNLGSALDTASRTGRQIPRALRHVVHRAMASDPAARYPNVAQMASEARDCLLELEYGRRGHRRWALLAAALATLALVATAALWYSQTRSRPRALLPDDLAFQKLTLDGASSWVSMSPDGKSFVILRIGQGLWLKRLSSTNEIQILDQARIQGSIYFLAVGADDWVYYDTNESKLWKVPLLGGTPQLVRENIGGFDFSPNRLRSVYQTPGPASDSKLWVANADLSAPRELPWLRGDTEFRWSLDSKSLLFVHSDGIPGGRRTAMRMAADSGRREELFETTRFGRVLRIADPPGGGWLVNGYDAAAAAFELWHWDGTHATRLTSGPDEFKLSDRSGEHLLGTSGRFETTLLHVDVHSGQARRVSQGSADVSKGRFLSDGRMIGLIHNGASYEIWTLLADGTPQIRLLQTPDPIETIALSESAGEVLFTWRTGKTFSLWRVGLSGAGLERLVPDAGVIHAAVSPDGRRVSYVLGRDGSYFLREADRAAPTRTLFEVRASNAVPLYSPKSDRLIYERYDGTDAWLVLRDLATGTERDHKDWRIGAADAWLDGFDGNREEVLATTRPPLPELGVSLLSVSGGAIRSIWKPGKQGPCRATDLDFSRDGRSLLVSQSCKVVDAVLVRLPAAR